MSDTSHFMYEIRQGLVWKIVSKEYFPGKQNDLVSEYSRWYGAQEKKFYPFRGNVCEVILLTLVNSSIPGAM